MGKHPVLRAEALAIAITILAGAMTLVYTFSTTYATNERVERIEDALKSEQTEMRGEMVQRFDRLEGKVDQIILRGKK